MKVEARQATPADLDALVELYRGLADEMTALHPQWPRRDGLPEPVAGSLAAAMESPESWVFVGEVEGVPVGFLLVALERSLPQAGLEEIGSIRLVFTAPEAREVGVAEAMRDAAMNLMRGRGVSKFDAHVLPGHRLAKNFFEAGGFSARSIIMHHDDHPMARPARDPRSR